MGFPKFLTVIWSFIRNFVNFFFGFETMEKIEQDGPPQSAPLSASILNSSINAMEKNNLKYVEQELSYREIVSLSFLLFGDDEKNRLYVQQRLLILLNSEIKDWQILQHFADKREKWKEPMLEALAIIRANKVLRKWGFDATQLRDIFLPHVPGLSTHINPILKALYYLAENLKLSESGKLISFVNENFDDLSEVTSDNPMFLEIPMLNWISKSLLKVGTWHRNGVTDEANVDILIQFLKENNFINLNETLIEIVDKFNSNLNSRPKNITTDRLISQNDANTSMVSQNMGPTTSQKAKINKKPYKVVKEMAGFILIINQEKFTREQDPNLQHLLPVEILKTRTGTNKDRDALKDAFLPHGYIPIVIENKDHTIVKRTIKEIVARSIAYDSLIVCILSHGSDGVVYAANSIPIEIKEIKNMITMDDALLRKPKVLLIQACQGTELQRARQVPEEMLEHDGPISVASCLDWLLLQSTVSGFASIRHREHGSWFIQTVCECIKKYGDSMHMEEMFTSVICEVSEKRGGDSVTCMVPQKESTLRYDFYLPKK